MSEPAPISVVLADNHALVLEGLRSLISAEEDIHVLATASDGERLLDAVKRFNPDVVITDLQMEYLDGLGCLTQIRQLCPQTRVLILTAYTDGQTMQSVLRSGADGLLLKTDPPEQAIQAVRQVMAGQLVFPAAARRWLHQAPTPTPTVTLSERELEVLELLAAGHTNAQIGKKLHVSVNTVKFHLQNIYQTLTSPTARKRRDGIWNGRLPNQIPKLIGRGLTRMTRIFLLLCVHLHLSASFAFPATRLGRGCPPE